MTSKHAERITGLFVRPVNGFKNCYGLFADEQNGLMRKASAANPSDALEALVRWNYDRVKHQVFEEQNWRCWHCWRLSPMSCDHIRPRAHGRCDERWNLRGMCAACHDLHTRNYKLEIHPKMSALMYNIGYRWISEWGLGVEQWGWEKMAIRNECG